MKLEIHKKLDYKNGFYKYFYFRFESIYYNEWNKKIDFLPSITYCRNKLYLQFLGWTLTLNLFWCKFETGENIKFINLTLPSKQ